MLKIKLNAIFFGLLGLVACDVIDHDGDRLYSEQVRRVQNDYYNLSSVGVLNNKTGQINNPYRDLLTCKLVKKDETRFFRVSIPQNEFQKTNKLFSSNVTDEIYIDDVYFFEIRVRRVADGAFSTPKSLGYGQLEVRPPYQDDGKYKLFINVNDQTVLSFEFENKQLQQTDQYISNGIKIEVAKDWKTKKDLICW